MTLEELVNAVPARVGVHYYDVARGSEWSHQGDDAFPAASVIKVAIFMEAYLRASHDQLDLSETVVLKESQKVGGAGVLLELHEGLPLTLEDLCRLMIVVSDNTASNLLIERLGFDAINATLTRLGAESSSLGRFFMETPTPQRDNRLTPRDASQLLRPLWEENWLRKELREHARATFARQQYREKIPLMLPLETVVMHKTGELEGVRHDCALVEGPQGPFVLTLLTAQGGPSWEVDLALARLARAFFEGAAIPR